MSRALLKLQLSDMGDSAAGFGGAKPKAKITKMKRKRGREVLICGCLNHVQQPRSPSDANPSVAA
jgi:hypothetical protein